jgi:transposase
MQIVQVGLDIAKTVFQVHAVNHQGRIVLRKALNRRQVTSFFAQLEPCVIGIEACPSAHHWGRRLSALGHSVRLMAPQFVKPYLKSNKNDALDAEAICEAVGRPHMRFVPVKTVEQQAILALHRARQGFVRARTAQANQIRGVLGEFGIAVPVGMAALFRRLPDILEDAENGLPALVRQLLERLRLQLVELDRQVQELENELRACHRHSEASQRLEGIPGIGPITATALVASIGNARSFKNGRQLAAWLGLVPRQHSTGGKPKLLGMSKRGDVYLRTLLIHGARAVIRHFERRAEQVDSWMKRMLARRHRNIAAVALANKNARIAWALLTRDENYAG